VAGPKPPAPGPPDPADAAADRGPRTEPREPAPPARAGRRRWPLVVGVFVALVGLAVGVQQRQVAAEWRDRATLVADERDDARGRSEAFQRQLDEVAAALATSEDDVVQLEDRVRELADEKAQAEDVATTTGVERDTLVALSGAIAGSVTALDTCVDEMFDLLNEAIGAFNRQGAGEDVDVAPLNEERARVAASCNSARQDAADAAATAEDLLR
jgi:hypothetical protein